MRIFKKNRGFSRINFFFTKLKTCKTHVFKIFIIHKPFLWSRDVPQKIWARSVQPFGYKQTNRHHDKPNLLIDC